MFESYKAEINLITLLSFRAVRIEDNVENRLNFLKGLRLVLMLNDAPTDEDNFRLMCVNDMIDEYENQLMLMTYV